MIPSPFAKSPLVVGLHRAHRYTGGRLRFVGMPRLTFPHHLCFDYSNKTIYVFELCNMFCMSYETFQLRFECSMWRFWIICSRIMPKILWEVILGSVAWAASPKVEIFFVGAPKCSSVLIAAHYMACSGRDDLGRSTASWGKRFGRTDKKPSLLGLVAPHQSHPLGCPRDFSLFLFG
jgi:hypothetical protein